ncbi:PAS domain S-box-containing protein [Marinospirillum celere]|uniref:histidine kinase n=1 Tax=Marinospirillum celere TaxID=1122252 RepID=A0A1I1DX18_9GAMM|nr:response regulator [Marinospirillum celere]SFB79485.1 PAS domain S-box-containing protein [Marinospirillum celere]
MNLSLSLRIMLLVLVTSCTLVAGMLLTVYQLEVANYELVVTERNLAEINRLSTELELTQQHRVLGLEAFAARLLNANGELLSKEAMQHLLRQPSVAKDLFPDGLIVFDSKATAIAESQFAEGRLGTNYADRPHFRRAKETKESVISEPILGRVTGLPLLSYLHPVLSVDGDILAYAGGILDLANTPLLEEAKGVETKTSATTLIIDPEHRLFVSMRERFNKPQPLPEEGKDPLVDAALSLTPPGSLVNYQEQQYLVASMQLASPKWIVLRALPYSEVVAPARKAFLQFLSIALTLTLLIATLGIWVARSLTQPLVEMTKRIDEMADAGRIENDFKEVGNTEVFALARAMNRLASEQKAANLAVRQAERFLANVLDSASEISIIATDTEGLITAFNRGAERMLGYKESEMVGKQTPAVMHLDAEIEERAERLSQELGRPIEGFRVFVEKADQFGSEKSEWTYLHKSGYPISVSLVVTTLRNDADEVTGYLSIAEDITEQKQIDKLKSEFISTVSHELRTPLTSISGALGLIVGGTFGDLPEKAKNLITTAYRNSQRLSYLINDLLDIEKIAAGKLHFDMKVQFLMPLIEQALESHRNYGSDRGITLRVAGNTPETLVRVDSQRLMQVLANLISNAIKFSPDFEEVTLDIESDSDKVTVSVIDKGPGIADSFRDKIFQRFAQADASDTRAKEGTGLGLSISRELIEKMGGRIDFESTEGKGSRFFFELPLHQSTTNRSLVTTQATENKKPRLLIVEDDPDVANLLSIMLNEAGYEVETAYTGKDALNSIKTVSYDLVTLDIALPDICGLDIIQQLRGEPKTAHLPIIVISAKIEEGRLAINGDLLNIDWLTKPIDQGRLTNLVQKNLSEHQHQNLRILHVEDDIDLHNVICSMVGEHVNFKMAASLKDARRALATEDFDFILLDLGMPDGSGWDLLPEIRHSHPNAKVVILSASDLTQEEYNTVEAALLKSRLSPKQLIDEISTRTVKPQSKAED